MIMYRRIKKASRNLAQESALYYVLLIVSVSITGNLQARTWYVLSEISTIGQALEDSASYGDTVLVAPGVYDIISGEDFSINMKNGVVLMSEEGVSVTMIEAHFTGRAFYCENCDTATAIAGFTITFGLASNRGSIYCHTADVIIINNQITNKRMFS